MNVYLKDKNEFFTKKNKNLKWLIYSLYPYTECIEPIRPL